MTKEQVKKDMEVYGHRYLLVILIGLTIDQNKIVLINQSKVKNGHAKRK